MIIFECFDIHDAYSGHNGIMTNMLQWEDRVSYLLNGRHERGIPEPNLRTRSSRIDGGHAKAAKDAEI